MQVPPPPLAKAPSRENVIKRIESETFDILIIGGGATGLSAALEATRRGFKVAVVEKNDFASGTSSRSTNMLHGGVRYLQNAIFNRKKSEMKLVEKGLKQEMQIYNSAPYMVRAVPICVPVYTKKEKKKYQKVLKKYDDLATSQNPFPELRWSTFKQLMFDFPNLRVTDERGNSLLGGWVYYDGQQDDARMALLIALTAQENSAQLLNYAEVVEVLKDDHDDVTGVLVNDIIHSLNQSGGQSSSAGQRTSAPARVVQVTARTVINATGPFSDSIRRLDKAEIQPIIRPAAGTHIVLPAHFSPNSMGLVIMETTDGRVLFSLPWQGSTLVGTTDKLVEVTDLPVPSDEEIDWILSELNRYLDPSLDATRADISSAWCGIRPLAVGTQSLTGTAPSSAQAKSATKGLTREHLIEVSPSNLISIAGGKWTTSQVMAKDVVDRAEAIGALKRGDASSIQYKENLVGADTSGMACHQKFEIVVVVLKKAYRMPAETAEMLQQSYGTRALAVAEIAQQEHRANELLHSEFPYIEAQVRFAARYERAERAVDVLSRRMRLAQVDVCAAKECMARVVEILAEELKWEDARCKREMEYCERYFKTMRIDIVEEVEE